MQGWKIPTASTTSTTSTTKEVLSHQHAAEQGRENPDRKRSVILIIYAIMPTMYIDSHIQIVPRPPPKAWGSAYGG
eukprot:1391184-Pyramimonas_sp.AAC.1